MSGDIDQPVDCHAGPVADSFAERDPARLTWRCRDPRQLRLQFGSLVLEFFCYALHGPIIAASGCWGFIRCEGWSLRPLKEATSAWSRLTWTSSTEWKRSGRIRTSFA